MGIFLSMPFAFVPFLLLVVPIVEIAAFIAIGSEIGIGLTLLMILVTAIIGSILLRIQGLSLLQKIQSEISEGNVPGRALGDGAMIVVAGVLLLTPGFVTDAIGFLLFVPGIRGAIWRFLASRISVVATETGASASDGFVNGHGDFARQGPTIDLDADEFTSGTPDTKSPWNKRSKT